MLKKLLKRLVIPAAVGCLGLFAANAQANSILINASTPTISGTGPFTWSYTADLTADSLLKTGDFFEVIDFTGFTGVTSQPVGWTPSFPMFTGTVVSGTNPLVSSSAPDSASVVNIRWTYTAAATIPGPSSFGPFTAVTTQNKTALGFILAQDHAAIAPAEEVTNNGTTLVPAAVPLPATASVGLALLAGMGGAMVLRRRAVKA